MKSLIEYINEAIEKFDLLKPKASNAQEAISLLDCIRDFLKGLKKQLSLTNKTDANKLFNDFSKSRELGILKNKFGNNLLSKYDIDTFQKFAIFLYTNASKFLDEDGKYKWDIKNIKQFNLSEREKEYKDYKKSDDYVAGIKWDKDDFDPNQEERRIVVYDRWDPSNIYVYPIKGKTSNKETVHQINLDRMDWCWQNGYKIGKKYFDAYWKLETNFYKNGPAKQDIDPNEFFDDI